MSFTAKVCCTSKTPTADGFHVTFGPDYQDGRNKAWAAATPSLSLSMNLNADAGHLADAGTNYTLTFEADSEETGPE